MITAAPYDPLSEHLRTHLSTIEMFFWFTFQETILQPHLKEDYDAICTVKEQHIQKQAASKLSSSPSGSENVEQQKDEL